MSAVVNLIESQQQFLHVSASAIRCLQECPRQFWLHYVEGRPPQDRSPRLIMGSAVHAALAHAYRLLRDCEPEPSLDVLTEIAHAHIAKAAVDAVPLAGDEGVDELTAQARGLLTAFLDEGYRPQHILAIEKAFALPLAGHDEVVVGVFDLVARGDDGGVVVIDHKTASRLDRAKAERVDVQMGLYALAASQVYGTDKVELMYQDMVATKVPKVVLQPVTRTPRDEVETTDAIHSALELIGVAVAHPLGRRLMGRRRSWMCAGCGWRRACEEVES